MSVRMPGGKGSELIEGEKPSEGRNKKSQQLRACKGRSSLASALLCRCCRAGSIWFRRSGEQSGSAHTIRSLEQLQPARWAET